MLIIFIEIFLLTDFLLTRINLIQQHKHLEQKKENILIPISNKIVAMLLRLKFFISPLFPFMVFNHFGIG